MFFNFLNKKNKKNSPLKTTSADFLSLEKAPPENFVERFREVVSDPLNLLIKRIPSAGYIDKDHCIILHNGNRVPREGPGAYYDNFSDLLIINRGVHEPLEEYCFQQMLETLNHESPSMIELGSYWAHYSMWIKKIKPAARCFMVESDEINLFAGKENFKRNGMEGVFIKDFVGENAFSIDQFFAIQHIEKLDILHSDIQGYEYEMIKGARRSLQERRIDYIFISTHSDELHSQLENEIKSLGYRLEVSSNFSRHTTSYDGFILATSPNIKPIFKEWHPWGRVQINQSMPEAILKYLNQ
jgi:hypothetical protein